MNVTTVVQVHRRERSEEAVFVQAVADLVAVGELADGVDDDSRDQAAGFLRAGAMFEVIPTRAIGMIERAEEFSERATRWVWG